MNNLLRSFNDELGHFLEAWLPQLFADWWERHVLGVLNYQQQEQVNQMGFSDCLARKDCP
ncbi:MAG: hypothetical protein A3J49_07175 [Gallionellales bacterium RIFCSPHIGHO2_02_FULL_57_16]|nr:MAG: hypothetical protein A3J49_07175 [Gallionellales bacterium RIFCSPHIGHO2_02_FULL_57_16]